MKDHYDFSQATQGKYASRPERLKLPIYLNAEVEAEMEALALMTGKEVNELVNAMLKSDLELLRTEGR